VHVVEDAAERWRGDAAPEQIERLHERHARPEQCGQFLVEDEEFLRADPTPLRQVERDPRDGVPRLKGQDVQTLLLQVVPQPSFGVGYVDAFNDFAVGRSKSTAKFHGTVCNCINLSAAH
jgi:hypothetical protein